MYIAGQLVVSKVEQKEILKVRRAPRAPCAASPVSLTARGVLFIQGHVGKPTGFYQPQMAADGTCLAKPAAASSRSWTPPDNRGRVPYRTDFYPTPTSTPCNEWGTTRE